MNKQTFVKLLLFLLFISIFPFAVSAQTKTLLKRTAHKTDKLDFGSGGTVVINGAPNGSIRVEGWNQNEIELSAEIQINASTESDIEQLTKVTGFVLEESLGRTGIISIGTHDKKYLKSVLKKFPKHLMGLPFRIDYIVKFPRFCDLEINGGSGDLTISGVEGMMKINYLETNAVIDLIGGGITATFGSGSVSVTVPTRSWRGRFADIQLAAGTMNVSLPAGLNAEIDASILRTGKIENEYANLKPRIRKVEFTEKSIAAKSGVGGVPLKFTIGDGTLNIFQARKPD